MLISQYTLTREISIYQVQLKIYEIFSDLLDALCFKKLSNRTARQLCFTGHIIFGCNIRYKPLSYLLKPKTDRKNAIRKKQSSKSILLFCFAFPPIFAFFCRDWRSLSLGCFLFMCKPNANTIKSRLDFHVWRGGFSSKRGVTFGWKKKIQTQKSKRETGVVVWKAHSGRGFASNAFLLLLRLEKKTHSDRPNLVLKAEEIFRS